MQVRALGARRTGRRHRSAAAMLVLAASLVCVALLVAPPAAFAGWPDDPATSVRPSGLLPDWADEP